MKNIRNNKGITIISLILTAMVILILTGAMIYNTKNQLEMKKLQNLCVDIEKLNYKIDEYYLKYGELPILCDFTNEQYIVGLENGNSSLNLADRGDFMTFIKDKAKNQNANINQDFNENDGNEIEDIANNNQYDKIGSSFNPNDGDEYGVIDLEKIGPLSLNYGYDLRR